MTTDNTAVDSNKTGQSPQHIKTIVCVIPHASDHQIGADNADSKAKNSGVVDDFLVQTAELALKFNARVILFSNVYSVAAELDTWLKGSLLKNMRETMIDKQIDYVAGQTHKLTQLLTHSQPKVGTTDASQIDATNSELVKSHVVWGKYLDEALTEHVNDQVFGQNTIDLVIKPSPHHFFATSFMRQPDEWRMIRMPEIPVVLIQERYQPIKRVLLAVDVTQPETPVDDEPANNEHSFAAIRTAQYWCSVLGAELHLMNAYPSATDLMAYAPAEWTVPDIQNTLAQQHRERLQAIAEQVNLPPSSVHVAEGHLAQGIQLVAQKINAQLLVVTSHCRSGVPGFFIGNSAETLLEHTQRNILVLKPVNAA